MIVHRIDDSFALTCTDQPLVISPSLQNQVDEVWDEEKRRKGDVLFDGKILSAVEVSSQSIIGRWVNYRYALAVYRRPELSEALKINPVAVNGVTLAGDRVLLARRAAYVSQYPSCWEFVPSGGIDPKANRGRHVDYRQAILDEFQEETGVSAEKVQEVTPFALFFDSLTSSWEIALMVRLPTDGFGELGSSEYDEFTWVERGGVDAFLEGMAEDEVVPLTREIQVVMKGMD